MIRVLLADDHALVRAGIRALVEDIGGMTVVAEASTGLEAIAMAARERPGLVLMDVSMADLNGIDSIKRIRDIVPDTRVIVISLHSDAQTVMRAFAQGAAGYIVKSSAPPELRLAIEAVMRGQTYVSPRVARGMVDASVRGQSASNPPLDALSPRQRQVLQMIAEGHNTKSIAYCLSMSVKTVETHRAALKERLGISHVAGLVRFAMNNRLVEGGGEGSAD
jgi:DNA-binding NarL/FixJ family response regulator